MRCNADAACDTEAAGVTTKIANATTSYNQRKREGTRRMHTSAVHAELSPPCTWMHKVCMLCVQDDIDNESDNANKITKAKTKKANDKKNTEKHEVYFACVQTHNCVRL